MFCVLDVSKASNKFVQCVQSSNLIYKSLGYMKKNEWNSLHQYSQQTVLKKRPLSHRLHLFLSKTNKEILCLLYKTNAFVWSLYVYM